MANYRRFLWDLENSDDFVAVMVLCRDLSLANGLVMRTVRDSIIIAPPLIISKEQIDELIGKVGKTLDDLRGRV